MTAGSGENDGSQRNNHNVSGIRGHIGHNPGEYNHRSQKAGGNIAQQLLQGRIDQSGVFSNTDTQHGNQNGTQWREAGKVSGG
ncbi:hypothetical protein SDC9_160766 [bioreactor metagenome]|uniref:Uncharacterized protein n=1 Tax=bioreactor metagenome TaxID=1076179 RepID=A0A645FGB5_9ZZZZ